MIQKKHTVNGHLKEQGQECPVCQTKNELAVSNCKTCAWYFLLAETPQFELELSRAKQQFQMGNTFHQVLNEMKMQSKMLEKISCRLDGLENEVEQIKENKPVETSINKKYKYPKLAPIQKVADFDTTEKRTSWWKTLETQWKKAFNQVILRKEKNYTPSDEEIKYVLETPTLRLVGPSGMHPSIDFELTNLSGIRHLTDLTLLVLSQNALTNLEGIEHLKQLKTLFVNNNKLTHLKEVGYLPQLKQLYCNANQIVDILPIANLSKLTVLNCVYNCLNTLEGILPNHANTMKDFYCLPNDNIIQEEVFRVETMGIACKKG